MAYAGPMDSWQTPRLITQQHWCQVPMEGSSSAGKWEQGPEGNNTVQHRTDHFGGRLCTLSLFASVFYNLIWFPLTKGKLPPASHGLPAWLFLTTVSTGTVFHLTTCHHLKWGLQEVYGGQIPCWWSPHWTRELQQQEEDVLSEARAWCTQTLFSRATAHLRALPFLSPAWRAASIPKGHGMLTVQIHSGFHTYLITSAAAMTKGHH